MVIEVTGAETIAASCRIRQDGNGPNRRIEVNSVCQVQQGKARPNATKSSFVERQRKVDDCCFWLRTEFWHLLNCQAGGCLCADLSSSAGNELRKTESGLDRAWPAGRVSTLRHSGYVAWAVFRQHRADGSHDVAGADCGDQPDRIRSSMVQGRDRFGRARNAVGWLSLRNDHAEPRRHDCAGHDLRSPL